MDENKKKLRYISGVLCILCGTFAWGCTIGYLYGQSKRKEIHTAYLFGYPSAYNLDDTQYYLEKVMEEIKKRDFKVSKDDLHVIANSVFNETESSRVMVNELFQIGED